jgi:pyruvate/2-oxoglutarate/acetoin dehydrogenase E1 component
LFTGDYEVPLGSVAMRREGTDVTILANMLMVHTVMAAAADLEQQGISAEVIDVRSLSPLDMESILQSARKTSRVLIVEEDTLTGGWGAEIAARISEAAFYFLDKAIRRIAAPDTPLPCAPSLEREYLPSLDKVVRSALELVECRKD